jgi:hypothetical protein
MENLVNALTESCPLSNISTVPLVIPGIPPFPGVAQPPMYGMQPSSTLRFHENPWEFQAVPYTVQSLVYGF